MTTSPLQDVRLHLVESVCDAIAFKTWLGERREGPLGIDCETGGLSAYRDGLRLIQFGDLNQGWAIPWNQWGGVALEAFREYTGDYVAHNSIFDWQFIAEHTGYEIPWERLHDTLTMARLDDPTRSNGLKPLATKLLDRYAATGQRELDEGMRTNKWTWATVPIEYPPYWIYGALDPVETAHLHKHFAPRIAASCPEAYSLERAANRICTKMMRKGMLLDVPYIEESVLEFDIKSAEIREWLKHAHKITSPKSPAQIGKALEKLGQKILFYTDRGAPQFDKEALAFYAKAGENTAVRQLAQYIRAVRHIEDIRDRYSNAFLNLRDANDVLHSNVNVMGARTGRMSISDPPLQQLPRDDKVIRGSFIPRPGHVFISCDLDQVEARLSAHFSGDEGLIRAFRDADEGGGDFFCGVASDIFRTPITKDDPRRQLTKGVVYGSIYGAGAETMAKTAGIPLEDMQPVKAAFDARFPGLKRMSDQIVREARQHQRPTTFTALGRPLIADEGREHTQLPNAKIQGTAAEYMKQSLVNMDASGLTDMLVLAIHDEAILEVPVDQAQDVLHTVREAMTDRTSYRVPLTAGGKILRERWIKA